MITAELFSKEKPTGKNRNFPEEKEKAMVNKDGTRELFE